MTSILELNQDCLNSIFKYFTIYELIDIEETCSAFKRTCYEVYESKKFHAYRIELRHLKNEYLAAALDRLSPTLRIFSFSGGYIMDESIKQNLVEAMESFCEKLTQLTINYVQFDQAKFEKLQKCFHNLTYLDLSRCSINENELNICLHGEKFKNIKTLKLAGNSQMCGAFFKDMLHVEVLDVSYCFELRYFHFLPFIKDCVKLIELDTTGSCQLIPEDQDILADLLNYQPHLEKITMDNVGLEQNNEILAKFKHLKHASFAGKKFGL